MAGTSLGYFFCEAKIDVSHRKIKRKRKRWEGKEVLAAWMQSEAEVKYASGIGLRAMKWNPD